MSIVANKTALSSVMHKPAIGKLPADADQASLLFAALFGANILAPSDGPNDAIASGLASADSHSDIPRVEVDEAVALPQAVQVFRHLALSGKDKAVFASGQGVGDAQDNLQGALPAENYVVSEPERIIANPLVAADSVSPPEVGTMDRPTGAAVMTGSAARSNQTPMVNLAFEDRPPKSGNVTTPRLPTASLTEEPLINLGVLDPRPPARVVPAPQQVMAKVGDDLRDFANKIVQQTGPAGITSEPAVEGITAAMPKLGMSVAAATIGADSFANEAGRAAMSVVGQVVGQGSQQNSQQNAGQSSGGSNYTFGATSQVSHENIMEMLDMAQDNWAEMLLNRVQTSLAGGKEKLEFLLNPGNLGKMKVTLGLQNDRAMVQINTETAAAAALLADSEGRLAQLMESSGLKLVQLNATQGQSGQGSAADQHARGQGTPNSTPSRTKADQDGAETHQENDGQTHMSDHLINVQA